MSAWTFAEFAYWVLWAELQMRIRDFKGGKWLLPCVERLAAPRARFIPAFHALYSCASYLSLLSLAALRLVSGILHVSPRPGLVKLLWLSRLRHHCFTARLFKGLQLLFLSLILLALRPPVPSLSGTSRRGFVHLTLVPFPDFMPQSFDALAHEFDLRHARIFHPFFIGPSLLLIRFFLSNLLLNSSFGILFNGPLYIPVVSLALLTEGRTARDLPKQRRSKKRL